MTDYACRFISREQGAELVNLYHLARTALVKQSCTPFDRMIWACAEFGKKYPGKQNGSYKDLCGLLGR